MVAYLPSRGELAAIKQLGNMTPEKLTKVRGKGKWGEILLLITISEHRFLRGRVHENTSVRERFPEEDCGRTFQNMTCPFSQFNFFRL